MIFYSWTALNGAAGPSVAMGVTDDRGRAIVVIIEAVRPAMAPRTLAPCYVPTGFGWLGQRTSAGEVSWNRFFGPADADDLQGPGRIGA